MRGRPAHRTRPRRARTAVADRGREADAGVGPRDPGAGARRGEGAGRRRDPRQRDLVALRTCPHLAPQAARLRRQGPGRLSPGRVRHPRLVRRGRPGARHAGAADADGADPRLGLALRRLARRQARLQARPEAVRRVRARARHALPDGEDVVDLERAEPALVAAPAVRAVGLVGQADVCVAVPRARRLGDRRPARDRPPRRADLARRDRAARRRSVRLLGPAQPARPGALREPDPENLAGGVPSRRVLPELVRPAPDRHGGARSALWELQASERDRLRPSPVHPWWLAPADVAHQHGRDHDRRGVAPDAPVGPRARAKRIPRGCRSTTPSTAGRPIRRIGSSASPTASRPST